MTGVAIVLGGGLGAVCRYAVEGAVAPRQRSPFPLSTLVVNVSGSLVLGLLVGATVAGLVPDAIRPWAVTGFFGGYTTFSTFTYENMRLIEDRAWRHVLWNLSLSGPLSFVAAGIGYLALSSGLG